MKSFRHPVSLASRTQFGISFSVDRSPETGALDHSSNKQINLPLVGLNKRQVFHYVDEFLMTS